MFSLTAGPLGCATSSNSGGSDIGTTPAVALSGNWKLINPDSPSPIMTGGISEQSSSSSSSHYTTAVLRVTAPCYESAPIVPFQGQVNGMTFQVSSFAVNDQTISLNGHADATGDSISGTYTTTGGCQGSTSGKFAAQRYASLTGTYAGSIPGSASQRIAIALMQDENPTGEGTFVLSGTAVLAGFPCFSTASIGIGDGFVSGSDVTLRLTADDAEHSSVVLNGTIDSTAKTITVGAGRIVGGSCSGSLGPLVLVSD
jgi:hypothetical protein